MVKVRMFNPQTGEIEDVNKAVHLQIRVAELEAQLAKATERVKELEGMVLTSFTKTVTLSAFIRGKGLEDEAVAYLKDLSPKEAHNAPQTE